ncbi:MAG: ribosome small subunit-dependent GTPase A [Syntrophaceticus sp.]
MEGLIIKGYGGFYYVRSGEETWCCRGRGRLRRGQNLLTGDRVIFTPLEKGEGVIEEVKERKNALPRPPVANVDQAVLVVSLANPDPDLKLLNRSLVLCELEKINVVICFNKIDLLDLGQAKDLEDIYNRAGYTTIFTSALYGYGLERLRQVIAGKVSVLSGPSGVGKSTLLNSLDPNLSLKTGEISKKLKRGKHTTRYVELIPICGGYVADTPGFSSLELPSMKRDELGRCFPEFHEYAGQCRFYDCIHLDEPDCEVKKALEKGLISDIRYYDYKQFLEEIISKERIY